MSFQISLGCWDQLTDHQHWLNLLFGWTVSLNLIQSFNYVSKQNTYSLQHVHPVLQSPPSATSVFPVWACSLGGSVWSPGCWLRWTVAGILVYSGSVQTTDSSRSPGNTPRATHRRPTTRTPSSRWAVTSDFWTTSCLILCLVWLVHMNTVCFLWSMMSKWVDCLWTNWVNLKRKLLHSLIKCYTNESGGKWNCSDLQLNSKCKMFSLCLKEKLWWNSSDQQKAWTPTEEGTVWLPSLPVSWFL